MRGVNRLNRRLRWLIASMLLLSTVFAACQPAAQNQTSQHPGQVQQQNNRPEAVKNPVPTTKKPQDPQATAERLAQLATQIPQVREATAVVFGKTAIVGIDLDDGLDRSRVGTVKYTVAEALKKDPQGANAIVTADPDIVERVREINREIQQGKPLEGFADELSNLIARLMPQFPQDIEPAPAENPEQRPTNPISQKQPRSS